MSLWIRCCLRCRQADRLRRPPRIRQVFRGTVVLCTLLFLTFWTSLLQENPTVELEDVDEDKAQAQVTEHATSSASGTPTAKKDTLRKTTAVQATSLETLTPRNGGTLEDVYPAQPARDGDWVSTDTYPRTKLRLFLYSAYLDNRIAEPVVRVIGAYACVGGAKLSCMLEYSNGRRVVVNATKKTINENWKLKYGASFFMCPYKEDDPPTRVRMKETYELQWSPSIPVTPQGPIEGHPVGKFTICVKPFHYKYDRASWLVEFIEFHRIVGVDHFFFYNHSTGLNVEKVLKGYTESGVVTMLPWNLDIKSQKEIRTEGIFASLNDCVYRSMRHFDYAVVLDVDEFMVPRKDDTLGAMIKRIKSTSPKATGFIVLNSFFYLYWDNDTTAYGEVPEVGPRKLPYMLTQFKTRRSRKVFRVGSRSKYIVQPLTAVEVGNHVVWRYFGRQATHPVSKEDALLHHYRICEFGGFDCLKQPSLVDRVALRFNASLLDRVSDVCNKAFPRGGYCPPAPGLGSPW